MLRKLSKLSFMNRRNSRILAQRNPDLELDDEDDLDIRSFNLDDLDDSEDKVVLKNFREA